MANLALYRKHRSQTFSDLIGQDHIVRTLTRAVAEGKNSQAYLFTGPRGTGKTSTARLLAKALNCPNAKEGEPCGTCEICSSITDGSSMDVVEIDAASESGVSEVREAIIETAEYRPSELQYKVYIIDEVHDLSAKAFDALLKTIEEPPSHAVFILATTEYAKVPPTVRSRCQRFAFHRGSIADLAKKLEQVAEAEGAEVETEAIAAIARMADGGYRDALTLLEQAILTADGIVTKDHVERQLGMIPDEEADQLIQAMLDAQMPVLVERLGLLYQEGKDPQTIIETLLGRVSDLTNTLLRADSDKDAAAKAGRHSVAASFGADRMLRLRPMLSGLHRDARDISLPYIWLESELIGISQAMTGAAVQTQPQASQPAAQPKATASAPAPAVKPAPAAPEPAPVTAQSKPVAAEPEQPASVPASSEQETWNSIFAELSQKSVNISDRMPGTEASREGDVIILTLKRKMHLKWAQEKVAPALPKLWKAKSGDDVTIRFQAAQRAAATPPSERVTTVESPLEGERLKEEVAKRFTEAAPQSTDQT